MGCLHTGHFLSVFPIVWAHLIQQLVCPQGTRPILAWIGSLQTTHSLPSPGTFPGYILGTLDCISVLHLQQWLQFSLQSSQIPESPQGRNLMIDFCCLHSRHSSVTAGGSGLSCTYISSSPDKSLVSDLDSSSDSLSFSFSWSHRAWKMRIKRQSCNPKQS